MSVFTAIGSWACNIREFVAATLSALSPLTAEEAIGNVMRKRFRARREYETSTLWLRADCALPE